MASGHGGNRSIQIAFGKSRYAVTAEKMHGGKDSTMMGCQCGFLARRHFLMGAAATGVAALGATRSLAQSSHLPSSTTKKHWVDVHHHFVPPGYLARVAASAGNSGGSAPPPTALEKWTARRSLDQMDLAGVETAFLSLSNPGVWFGDKGLARTLARDSNEYCAKLIAANPGRFGMFATLPLPDMDGSLAEAAYALDILKADGIGLFTSYQDRWLGDPLFDPLFEELNRRHAVVYTHPTTANCCRALQNMVPSNLIEYQTDTSRAIAGILAAGIPARYPNIKIIFSHAGGTMPYLIERFVGWAKSPPIANALPQGLMPALANFYYDTAQVSNPIAMGALSKLVPSSQILFGTDYPFRLVDEQLEQLTHCGVFDSDKLSAIGRDNALILMKRATDI